MDAAEFSGNLYIFRNIHLILPIWRSDCQERKADMTFAEHREVIREVVSRYSFVNIIDGYDINRCIGENCLYVL